MMFYDDYLCQWCAELRYADEHPPVWMQIPSRSYSGNVCPSCVQELISLEKSVEIA